MLTVIMTRTRTLSLSIPIEPDALQLLTDAAKIAQTTPEALLEEVVRRGVSEWLTLPQPPPQ